MPTLRAAAIIGIAAGIGIVGCMRTCPASPDSRMDYGAELEATSPSLGKPSAGPRVARPPNDRVIVWLNDDPMRLIKLYWAGGHSGCPFYRPWPQAGLNTLRISGAHRSDLQIKIGEYREIYEPTWHLLRLTLAQRTFAPAHHARDEASIRFCAPHAVPTRQPECLLDGPLARAGYEAELDAQLATLQRRITERQGEAAVRQLLAGSRRLDPAPFGGREYRIAAGLGLGAQPALWRSLAQELSDEDFTSVVASGRLRFLFGKHVIMVCATDTAGELENYTFSVDRFWKADAGEVPSSKPFATIFIGPLTFARVDGAWVIWSHRLFDHKKLIWAQ